MTPYQLIMLMALGGLMIGFLLIGCGIAQEWRAYRNRHASKSLPSGLMKDPPAKQDYWRDWSKAE